MDDSGYNKYVFHDKKTSNYVGAIGEAFDVEAEVYCRRRSRNFWRMQASFGLACAQAAPLGTQSPALAPGLARQRAPVPEHRLPVMGLFRLCASRSFSLPTNVSLSLSPSGETTWQSARSTSLTASPLPPVPTLCVRGGSFALCAAGPQG